MLCNQLEKKRKDILQSFSSADLENPITLLTITQALLRADLDYVTLLRQQVWFEYTFDKFMPVVRVHNKNGQEIPIMYYEKVDKYTEEDK